MLFGVASENAKLRDVERIKLLEQLLENRGDLVVVASIADHSAELAAERARRYQEMGADFINILPPSFLAPTSGQIAEHLELVLQRVSIPTIIQHLPQGGGLTDTTIFAALHERYPQLTMIKCEANPPMESITEVTAMGNLAALVGWGGLYWADGIAAGAVGVQPGCSLSDLYLSAQAAQERGDETLFKHRLDRFLPQVENWISTVERLVAVEKYVLQSRGLVESAYCRRPTVDISMDRTALDKFLAHLGLA